MEKKELDYAKVFDTIVGGLTDYLKRSGIKTMVLGLSGGIDSSVIAAICHEAAIKTESKLLGVSLMCSTNKSDEVTTADLVGKAFCDEYYKENIQPLYEQASDFFSHTGGTKGETTKIAEGNIKARIRMMYLWHLGGLRNGLVMDTDNMTEHYLGFFTINGDCNYLTPIGALWKTEVYGLSNYLVTNRLAGDAREALQAAIDMTPTDGNGVSGSDLDQIMPGATYQEVDDILRSYLADSSAEGMARLYARYGGSENDPLCGVNRVVRRCRGSEFKRKHIPLSIDIHTGEIIEERKFSSPC